MKRFLLPALLRTSLIAYALLFGHPAKAQQVVVTQPDCIVFFHFTASGQTSPLAPNLGFSNLTNGCTTWNFSYANTGFSAISLTFQSAPNVSGVAGTWVTFANGTLLSGINPNTNTTGAFTWLTGYNPWVRAILSSATGAGEVDGAIYGYRIPSAGSTPAATANVNITQVGSAAIAEGQTTMANSFPVVIASNQSAIPVTSSGTQATNLTQVGGAAVALGQAAMAASVPVAIASNQGAVPVSGTVAATQSGVWTVQPGNTPNTTAWKVDGSAVTQPVSIAASVPVAGAAASGTAPVGNPLWWAGLGSGATGGLLYPVTACDSSAVVTVSAAATTQIVALTSGRAVRVCSFALSISLGGSAQWVTGTGSNCAGGTSNLTGAFSIATGITSSQGTGLGELFKTPVSQALCLTAAVGNITGVVSYAAY